MPKIKPEDKTKLEPLTLKLRPEIIASLRSYATFLNDSSLDYVAAETFKDLFRDKDFQQWLAASDKKSKGAAA